MRSAVAEKRGRIINSQPCGYFYEKRGVKYNETDDL